MNIAEYPLITDEEGLPFLVCGMGKQAPQCHIKREDGYCIHQFMYIKNGMGKIIYNQKEYILKKGDCICLGTDIPYEYFPVTEDWALNWISFTGNEIQNTMEKLELADFQVINFENLEEVEAIFNRMLWILKAKSQYCVHTCGPLLYEILLSVFIQKKKNNNEGQDLENHYIEQILSYMDEHYNEVILLEEIAKQAGISSEYVCVIFRRKMNMRPFEYLTKKRIQVAKMLLIDTNLTIQEIGNGVGYPDKSYFGFVFKKQEKVSPSQFRGMRKAGYSVILR